MYATSIDLLLPPKWQSSVAVYVYEPPPDPAVDDPNERTTFLKVAASITGYEPFDFSFLFPYSVNPIYFPAYSALLQLAVFPHGPNPAPNSGGVWNVNDYPYVADCQPQKRELIETTTEGGEVVSQSATAANVRKSTTTTNKLEQAGGYPILHTQGTTWESQDIRTTDALQESRQTNSYSTQLSQLYHLLDSYHTGTNRVLFFVNARPHLIVSDFTFAQGPRNLEGIQEFIVLVRRPATMDGICVRAVLETAHLNKYSVTTTNPPSQPQPKSTTLQAHLYVISPGTIIGQEPDPATSSVTIQIPPGFVLDTTKGGGDVPIQIDLADGKQFAAAIHVPLGVWITSYAAKVQEGNELAAIPAVMVSADGLTITVTATARGWGNYGDTSGRVNCDVYVYAVEPITQTTTQETTHYVDLFTTAREASGCVSQAGIEIRPTTGYTPYIWYEGKMDATALDAYQAASETGKSAVIAANNLSRQVAAQLRASVGAPTRYAPGEVTFGESRVATRMLLDGMGPSGIASRLSGTNLLERLKLTGVTPTSQAFVSGIAQAPLALRRDLLAALKPPPGGSVESPPTLAPEPGKAPDSRGRPVTKRQPKTPDR